MSLALEELVVEKDCILNLLPLIPVGLGERRDARASYPRYFRSQSRDARWPDAIWGNAVPTTYTRATPILSSVSTGEDYIMGGS